MTLASFSELLDQFFGETIRRKRADQLPPVMLASIATLVALIDDGRVLGWCWIDFVVDFVVRPDVYSSPIAVEPVISFDVRHDLSSPFHARYECRRNEFLDGRWATPDLSLPGVARH